MIPPDLDITDSRVKARLDMETRRDLDADEALQSQYHAEWNSIDARLIGDDTPFGMSKSYSKDYSKSVVQGDPTPVEHYISVNRAHPLREGNIGDFIVSKKKLTITGRNPSDNGIAKVIGKRIEETIDRNQFNTLIFLPAIDRAFSKGLDWIGVEYQPMANNFKGAYKVFRCNLRDVLVDAHGRGDFFTGDTRRTWRYHMKVEDANRRYRKYPIYSEVSPDTDYLVPYVNIEDVSSNMNATFYKIEFVRFEAPYFFVNPQTQQMEQISEQQYDEMSKTELAQFLLEGDEETPVYYRKYYNRRIGVFYVEKLPYQRFTLIPLVNVESDARKYPVGDTKLYGDLLDLTNVLATVILKSVKRGNKPIGILDSAYWNNNEAIRQAKYALDHGGVAVGLTRVEYHQQINQGAMALLNIIGGFIQDVAAKHEASTGELPSRQIARETVEMLIRRDRTSHGRKDVTINYALTEIGKLLAEMITVHDDQEDFIEVTDAPIGSPNYIPINHTLTEDEYKALLVQIFKLKLPQQPTDDSSEEAIMQYQQALVGFSRALEQAREKFEDENKVRSGKPVAGFSVSGKLFREEQLIELIAESGLTQEEFMNSADVQEVQIPTFEINKISGRALDLNIKFGVDFDYDSDTEYKENRALLLHKLGMKSRLDTLKALNESDAEGALRRADEENQALQLAKQLVANPQILLAAQQLIRQAGVQ